MMPIFIRAIRDRKISLFAYCVIGIGLLWLYIALFPSIQASSAQLEKLFQSYPKGLYQALGVQELSFNTIEKFLAVELFSFMWPILAITFALSRAGGTIAGEIEKGTMGLFLSLPISRLKLFLAKYSSELFSILVFTIFTVISIIPLTALYGESADVMVILKLSILSFLFMWSIFAASMFLSALFSERSKVYMIMGGALLIMYAANVLASLKPSLSWLHKGSIFYYYNAQDILTKDIVRISFIIIIVGIVILFTAIGAWTFSKRDIIS